MEDEPFVAQKTHDDQWHAGLRGATGQRDPGLRRRSQPVSLHYTRAKAQARLSRRRDNPGQSGITWNSGCASPDVTTKSSHFGRDPKQQLGYLQVKNWARLYCSGAILGVHAGRTRREGTW